MRRRAGGDRGDPVLRHGTYLARLAHAVAVRVGPEREALKLAACEPAVAVVVERGERLVAVVPEDEEADRAEHPQPALDASLLLGVPDEPRGLCRDPTPAAIETGATSGFPYGTKAIRIYPACAILE